MRLIPKINDDNEPGFHKKSPSISHAWRPFVCFRPHNVGVRGGRSAPREMNELTWLSGRKRSAASSSSRTLPVSDNVMADRTAAPFERWKVCLFCSCIARGACGFEIRIGRCNISGVVCEVEVIQLH